MKAENATTVVTSIQTPTSAMHTLAKKMIASSMSGIVVGDQKGPPSRDFDLEPFRLISIENQKKLPFEIVKAIPPNHYSKKILATYWQSSKAPMLYTTPTMTTSRLNNGIG